MTELMVSRRVALHSVRTARATEAALGSLNGAYPRFVHKWSRQRRHYQRTDLHLPAFVNVCGHWPNWTLPVIGVGGTRSPTVETFCLVSEVVRQIAQTGVLIISGGVPGVDLSAHLAALDSRKGVTLAVLANPAGLGLDGHEWHSATVSDRIMKSGGFISEYTRGCQVGTNEFRERLLARDRIISGLCDVFVAFECSQDSGTVDTARRALVQGKDVIGIHSLRHSPRRGIEQLAEELSVPMLDERKLMSGQIVSKIVECLYGSLHGGTVLASTV